MKTNANHDLINDAKQYARETIHETWPTAREVAEPTADMYEFDAICIDDEACPISSISVMHDPDADMFALVENARPTKPLKEAAELVPAIRFDAPIDWDKLAEDHAVAYLRVSLARTFSTQVSIFKLPQLIRFTSIQ